MSQNKKYKNKDICEFFFGSEYNDPSTFTWKCRHCAKFRKQNTDKGYTNLMSHIKDEHPNYERLYEAFLKESEELDTTGANNASLTTSKQTMMDDFFDVKTNNIYKWLDWVIMDELSLMFPEKERTRKNTNLEKISTKTLKKYMFLVEHEVKEIIIKLLTKQPNVALVFDGWSANSIHFIGLFVSYPGPEPGSSPKIHLLRFAPLLDSTSFTAVAHKEFIQEACDYYKIPLSKVVCLIGDNCSTNKALANLLKKPLVGCRSHRLNIAVEAFVVSLLDSEVRKITALMTKLKTLKGAGKLKRLTGLKPKLRNITRWTGVMNMFERFKQLQPHIATMGDDIIELMPTLKEIRNIAERTSDLVNLKKVTIELQSKSMTLLKSEGLFVHIISSMQCFDFTKYLSPDANIVHHAVFEKALVKIQEGNEAHLTEDELEAVSMLRKNDEGKIYNIMNQNSYY